MDKKSYICDNINELNHADRLSLLKMVYNSPYKNQLREKGTGILIKLDELSDQLIDDLYFHMLTKINANLLHLNELTSHN
jgi:hypothetical protein